jgi:hypothetical protein
MSPPANAEFAMAAPNVLHEGVTQRDHACSTIAFQAPALVAVAL